MMFTRRAFLKTCAGAATTLLLHPHNADAYPGNYRQGLPTDASEAIDELYRDKNGLKSLAFSQDNGWVLLWGPNGWRSRGVPEKLNEKLSELNNARHEIKRVVLTPEDRWIVLWARDNSIDSWNSRGFPQALTDVLHRLDSQYSTIKDIAFSRDGSWVILHGFNGFVSEGIPDSAVETLNALRGKYIPFKQIAFTSNDGWVILYGSNGYSARGCPQAAIDKLREYHDEGFYIRSIHFTKDDGWMILYDAQESADVKYWEIGRNPPLHVYAHNFPNDLDQHNILMRSLGTLHDRFTSEAVLQNSYRISRTAYYIDDDYWLESNVKKHPKYGPRELLRYQIETLRLPLTAEQARDEGPPMPEIHLYPYNKRGSEWGFALWGNKVIVKYVGGRIVERTGDFKIHLNTYQMGTRVGQHGANPAMWACVMGHELLHNLGHAHDTNDYGDNRQINCFHRAIYCNGNYAGRDVPSFVCGCKPPI
jgi:hypothetical protein